MAVGSNVHGLRLETQYLDFKRKDVPHNTDVYITHVYKGCIRHVYKGCCMLPETRGSFSFRNSGNHLMPDSRFW